MHAHGRSLVLFVLFAAALLLSCGCSEQVPMRLRTVAPCSWSYFGDPRSVAHEEPRLHRLRRHRRPRGDRGRRSRHGTPAGADAVRAARGRRPQQSKSRVLSRAALRVLVAAQRLPLSRATVGAGCAIASRGRPWAGGGGWGADAHGPAGAPDAVSATPIRTRWSRVTGCTCSCVARAGRPTSRRPPTGGHWDPGADRSCGARRRQPSGRRRDGDVCGRTRSTPARPDGSVLIALSDGHPASFKSFAVLRPAQGRPLPRGGRPRGSARVADLPLGFARLDRVGGRTSPAGGRAWPMDIAQWTAAGGPVIVYRRSSARATPSATAAGTGGAGARSRSSRRAGRCSAITTRASRSTTRTHRGSCSAAPSMGRTRSRRVTRRTTAAAGVRSNYAQVALVQHPPRDPARLARSAQAGRGLRLRLGQELP